MPAWFGESPETPLPRKAECPQFSGKGQDCALAHQPKMSLQPAAVPGPSPGSLPAGWVQTPTHFSAGGIFLASALEKAADGPWNQVSIQEKWAANSTAGGTSSFWYFCKRKSLLQPEIKTQTTPQTCQHIYGLCRAQHPTSPLLWC